MIRPRASYCLLIALFTAPPTTAAEPIVLREGLALPPAGGRGGGRAAVAADPVLARLVAGDWTAPKAGDTVERPGSGSSSWEPIKAGDDGRFQGRALAGGYVVLNVESDRPRVAILEAAGHTMAFIGGEPRAGDPYSHGYVHLPVKLREGSNELLFRAARGSLSARLVEPKADALLDLADPTVPDLVAGQPVENWAAAVVLNATERPTAGLRLRATLPGDEPVETELPTLSPLSARKVGVRLAGNAPAEPGKCAVNLELLGKDGLPVDTATLNMEVVRPEQARRVTFRSGIDGSIQYYGLVPAKAGGEGTPGLILTLHGASVEGIGQARVYRPKDWAHVVAPTNRRPFGFDWEDWGRIDALEVLEVARGALRTDPRRTWLTGHSMGGHGTWHLGVTFPDRWAAIAPSAGWVSMWSYAGLRETENPDPIAALIRRAAGPSDTLSLAPNLTETGVYVLHGDADDNVPIGQARTMRERLAGFHPDFSYYERPGAGHWWGDECCDWPPLMEFLSRHTLPDPSAVRRVDFRTFNPAVSARDHWATIGAQTAPLKLSTIQIDHDPAARRFAGTTENVARLALDLAHLATGGPVEVKLDGQTLAGLPDPEDARRLWLERRDGRWSRIVEPAPALKGPHRAGPFKEAFRHRFQLVYGTKGTAEENAWSLARSRFDAETFWYRGNGSVAVVADADFDPSAEPDRSVILYGNADTNAAWPALLGESPAQVRRGSVRVGDRTADGDDLACLLVRPRPGSDVASVGVVGGTGIAGLRLTVALPYFVSGVAYPDLVVVGPEALARGNAGIRVAGFFGDDWGIDTGEFAWQAGPAGGG